MRPIETRYNGYHFRSRLEARWAVFFSTLGIEYKYEHEGIQLDDGRRWLPDFWLPKLGDGYLVEVKGDPDRLNLDMLKQAAVESDTAILILGEIPPDGSWVHTVIETDRHLVEYSFTDKYIVNRRHFEHRLYWDDDQLIEWDDDSERLLAGRRARHGNNDLYVSTAYHRARTARFEHGETPKVETIYS